jgi:DNA-binding transcriptional MerR regulator
MEMSKIEEAIEDIINAHLSSMDFSDMITTEVRECWDMDEIDRIDEIADAVENLENNLDSATLENMDQKIDQLTEHVDQKLKELQDRVNVIQSLQLERKSFIQKLMFWR